MASVLGHLDPPAVWQHFETLCSIPRPSRKEAKAAAWVSELARAWGLEVLTDDVGNVIVKKPATRGMEDRRTVVMQCHLDMVPQKTQDSPHNFESDPIRPRIEGNLVRATKTTLGADDGIGVSVALAVLQSKELAHGPLEALFTIDEETGMTGANGLKPGLLKGDILLNLDSEDEGELCIGCAGGADFKARLTWNEDETPKGSVAVRVDVSGLKGGHSGVDIHLGRANANKVLTRVLFEALGEMDLRLVSFVGGDLRNAIPRSATAVITVKKEDAERFIARTATLADALRREVEAVDPGLKVEVSQLRAPKRATGKTTTARILKALTACPHGVFAMVRDMPTVTETSTNLAIVKAEKGRLDVVCMLRSSVDSKKTDVANMLISVFELAGARAEVVGGYPGWRPDVSSPVLAMLKTVYADKFGTPAKVTATHGGLECGIIRSVYPHMDAVSIGPTVRFPHSPDEQVDIPSVKRFWDFLVEALRQIPKA